MIYLSPAELVAILKSIDNSTSNIGRKIDRQVYCQWFCQYGFSRRLFSISYTYPYFGFITYSVCIGLLITSVALTWFWIRQLNNETVFQSHCELACVVNLFWNITYWCWDFGIASVTCASAIRSRGEWSVQMNVGIFFGPYVIRNAKQNDSTGNISV